MTTATLSEIHSQLARLTALVAESMSQPQEVKTTQLAIPETNITLQPGEHYAGAVLDSDGNVKHHLVLMTQRPDGDLDWDGAMAWATEVGGMLPSRQEQSLLFANCKPHLKPEWYWSSEQHEENASCAWGCYFDDGTQSYYHKSAEGAAVAVRRVTA